MPVDELKLEGVLLVFDDSDVVVSVADDSDSETTESVLPSVDVGTPPDDDESKLSNDERSSPEVDDSSSDEDAADDSLAVLCESWTDDSDDSPGIRLVL